jgi:hypothetical protein
VIWPHLCAKNGLSYIESANRGSLVKIYIDRSTVEGERIWKSRELLLHTAIYTLAAYYGCKVNIFEQLRLPLGDTGDAPHIKIAKAMMYLLSHIDPAEFKPAIAA